MHRCVKKNSKICLILTLCFVQMKNGNPKVVQLIDFTMRYQPRRKSPLACSSLEANNPNLLQPRSNEPQPALASKQKPQLFSAQGNKFSLRCILEKNKNSFSFPHSQHKGAQVDLLLIYEFYHIKSLNIWIPPQRGFLYICI